jgi:multidrug efflux pump subunit AcrA (membrane-fusion protein)
VEGLAPVQLGERALTLAGVQTEAAVKEVMQREIRTVGIVLPDERLIRHIHTKNSGWIEKLYINFTGQLVKKGEPVLGIYSPELLASQEEFLKARETAAKFANSSLPEVRRGGQDLVDAARKRLRLFDVPEKFIEELEKTGLPKRTVTLPAPVSGYVTAKGTFEGQQVEPGTVLFTITDLSRVWIEADFYEYESQAVHTGQEANVSFPYGEAKLLKGKVSYVYPYLNPDSRTLKVRFEFANPELMLKPSMYVDVLLAINASESIVVPDSAVIDSGLRQIVFVEKAKGLFEPREVTVGLRSGGKAQVLAGLSEGERVVVGANFLIDSESRLKAAVGAMEGHRHGN